MMMMMMTMMMMMMMIIIIIIIINSSYLEVAVCFYDALFSHYVYYSIRKGIYTMIFCMLHRWLLLRQYGFCQRQLPEVSKWHFRPHK